MRRLYFRIILGLLAILVLSFSVPPLLFHREPERRPRPEPPIMLSGSTELLKARLENVPPSQLKRELDSLNMFFRFPLTLVDVSDTILPPDIRLRGDTGNAVSEETDEGHERVYVPLNGTGKILIVGRMMGPRRPEMKSIILVVALVLGIVGISGFLIMAPVVRDLRLLENAASRFGQGDLASRAEMKSHDAVASVAKRFNIMAGSIQGLIQRERQLLQSVSHELRTPIARIRFNLDMLQDAETPEEQRRRIEEIDGEVSEIDQLVGELLDYNRVHSESLPVDKKAVSVRQVLDEITARFHDFRPGIDIEIHPETDSACQVTADRLLFRRALQNLLSNALRFASKQVIISYTRGNNETIVDVCDDGPGIAPERREGILMPFNRREESDCRLSGGVGLGLSIVRRIIELHDGSMSIGDADIGGARFTTRWPDNKPPSQGRGGKKAGKAV